MARAVVYAVASFECSLFYMTKPAAAGAKPTAALERGGTSVRVHLRQTLIGDR